MLILKSQSSYCKNREKLFNCLFSIKNQEPKKCRNERRKEKVSKNQNNRRRYLCCDLRRTLHRNISESGNKKKKMGNTSYGIDIGALREILALQKLSHTNIVNLIEVFPSKKNVNLVLEFLENDLKQIIRSKSVLYSTADVKSWILMLLKGIQH